MTGLSFAHTKVGQRVVGNKLTNSYEMPDGWNDSISSPTWTGKVGKDDTCVLVLCQPDKSLDLKPSHCPTHTYVRDFKRTEELVELLQRLTVEELQDLMGLGKKIAKSHHERFQHFERYPAKQACLMFGGDALSAADFGDSDRQFADAHLRLLSGLYGLLRPYDDVKPVRDLPIRAKLSSKRGGTVGDFWADSVTRQLSKDITELNKRRGQKVLLVACLSDEYWRVVQTSALPPCVDVVRLTFEGASDESVRRARGLFARHVVRQRVEDVEGLRAFSHDDWAPGPASGAAGLVFLWDGDASGARAPRPSARAACEPGYHSSGSSCGGGEAAGGAAARSGSRGRSRGRGRSRSSTPPRGRSPQAQKKRQRSSRSCRSRIKSKHHSSCSSPSAAGRRKRR